jgi:hypothetical protein
MSVRDARKAPFVWASTDSLAHLREHWDADRAEVRAGNGIAIYHALTEIANDDRARQSIGDDSARFRTSKADIAERACVSPRSAERACRELAAIGLLLIEHDKEGENRPGRASYYTLLEPDQTYDRNSHVEDSGGTTEIRTPCDSSSDVDLPTSDSSSDPPSNRKKNSKKEEKKKEGDPSGDAAFLDEIFELWKRLTNRNDSTIFSPKRKRAIRMRLKDGHSPNEIRRAVMGCAASDWHMKRGKHANRDGRPHNDLTLILRDTEHVEEFARMAGDLGPPVGVGLIAESAAASQAWDQAKQLIRQSLPESTFDLWVAPMEAAGERDGALVLLDTSDRGGWADRRYKGLFKEALSKVTDDYSGIEIISHIDLEMQAA